MSKKLWSSYEKDQLMMENFRKFIEGEDFAEPPELLNEAYVSRPGRDAALAGGVAAAGTVATGAGATIGALLGGILGFLAGGAPALPGAIGGAAGGGTLGATAGFGAGGYLANYIKKVSDNKVLSKLGAREVTEASLIDFLLQVAEEVRSAAEEEGSEDPDTLDIAKEVGGWFSQSLEDSGLSDKQIKSIRFERDALVDAAEAKGAEPVFLEAILEALEEQGLLSSEGAVAQLARKGSEKLRGAFDK